MANPQTENGYTAISNEILEALCRTRINGECMQVVFCVIRKTYGFKKKEDRIALSQFVLATGLKKPTVCKALNKAYQMNIITQKDTPLGNVYRFNKDFDTWRPLPKKITITQRGNKSLPKKIHTKETNTKENIHPQIKSMYSYEKVDEFGNPLKRRLAKIDEQTNKMLISVGLLWQQMASSILEVRTDEVPMRNLYYPIRKVYDREKWSKEEFKGLFKYYLEDKSIAYEKKLSFDLCLSEKYISQYKLNQKKRSMNQTNVSVSSEIKL